MQVLARREGVGASVLGAEGDSFEAWRKKRLVILPALSARSITPGRRAPRRLSARPPQVINYGDFRSMLIMLPKGEDDGKAVCPDD